MCGMIEGGRRGVDIRKVSSIVARIARADIAVKQVVLLDRVGSQVALVVTD